MCRARSEAGPSWGVWGRREGHSPFLPPSLPPSHCGRCRILPGAGQQGQMPCTGASTVQMCQLLSRAAICHAGVPYAMQGCQLLSRGGSHCIPSLASGAEPALSAAGERLAGMKEAPNKCRDSLLCILSPRSWQLQPPQRAMGCTVLLPAHLQGKKILIPKISPLRSRRKPGLRRCLGQFLIVPHNNFSFSFQEDFFPPPPFPVSPLMR